MIPEEPGAETETVNRNEDTASVEWHHSSEEEEERELIFFWLSFKLQKVKMERGP